MNLIKILNKEVGNLGKQYAIFVVSKLFLKVTVK